MDSLHGIKKWQEKKFWDEAFYRLKDHPEFCTLGLHQLDLPIDLGH
jgi:hypothetical protein